MPTLRERHISVVRGFDIGELEGACTFCGAKWKTWHRPDDGPVRRLPLPGESEWHFDDCLFPCESPLDAELRGGPLPVLSF